MNNADQPPRQTPGDRRGVLVIDDEPHIREAIIEILDLVGVETTTASSGASGVSCFAEKRDALGLIILDLSMPGMSGEETVSALRAIDEQIPIVITSGHSEEDLDPRLAAVTQGFLQKPFSVSGLVDLAQQHL